MSPPLEDLRDEVAERRERIVWEGTLNLCPCCGALPSVAESSTTGDVVIACSKTGCKIVSAKNIQEASKIWNEVRFTQRRD